MNNDLISISEAKMLGATCLARRNENGQLEAVISLDNAPTVEPKLSDKQIEEIADLLEIQWGYEGIREDVSRILRGEENG